ncbi:cupin domain-containing protein [Bosea sp. BK604]|uniref:cupin domain-containing protein n=1 Tax=Bosea sp. BK604 TaxID=2512180 RepID=UPI00104E24D6|nr:cupin domain-containing protein [Bosea sp. BK604]TCR62960.1 quercetin dioxygenase-like cupin family protein [Bosea sp. BK604]
MRTTLSAAATALLLIVASANAQDKAREPGDQGRSVTFAGAKNAKVTQVYQRALPGIPGKSLKGVLVEYGPGGYSPSHTHAKSAVIYATVIEGSVRSQVGDGPVVTYRTGQNWTELPGDHHRVSANASRVRPAKILAVFVVDDADPELTIPDKN